MAKTQYSLTDDQTKLGRPTGFRITVRQVTISAGAGFVVALTGDIMKMPGLPKVPAAERIDEDETGKITGLFYTYRTYSKNKKVIFYMIIYVQTILQAGRFSRLFL